MNKIMHKFEKTIITILLIMMTVVVALGTIELAVILFIGQDRLPQVPRGTAGY